jgi:2-hydroxy-6-oxonona-2,4-dienedioate hydrolase
MGRAFVIVLAILIVGTVCVYAKYAHDLAAARSRLVDRSKTMVTSFGTMEYAVLGQGEPMLIVHGAEGGFDQSLDMTGEMVRHGYQLIAPSRFGYLRSTLPAELTTAMQADAYAQLLDRLGKDKVVVVGISAGAWSALQFAIQYPKRCQALVLLVPANYLPAGTSIHGGAVAAAIFDSDFLAWIALQLMPIMPGAMTGMMLGTNAAVLRTADREEKERLRQILDHLLPVSARYSGMQFDLKTAANRELSPIERITCPVLTISAEDDAFGTASRAKSIAAGVPDGKANIYATGGHALVGHYADALRVSASFLQAVRERQHRGEDPHAAR